MPFSSPTDWDHPTPMLLLFFFYVLVIIKLIMNVVFSAPSAPPTSVTTPSATFSSITVQWGPVNCIDRNGDITGYSVRYGVQGGGSTQTKNVSGSTTETTISGLQSSTNYAIEVVAVNGAGTGPFSSPITMETPGG